VVHLSFTLIFGGDLPSDDPATTPLITNEEVLAVDQNSSNGHEALARGNIRVWIAQVPNSHDHYLAAFDLGDNSEEVNLAWKDVGIEAQTATVRDLWKKTDLETQSNLYTNLDPHASLLYRVSPVD
jgi:alpha-galactosidase